MQEILVYGFLIFFICSFIGYFMEVFWVFLGTHKWVNRGFLCGPIIPIYGWGAVLILFCLLRYYDSSIRFNLNGRICLRNSIAFGVLALVVIYFVTPLLGLLFSLASFKFWSILALILFIFVALDTVYSIIIAYNLRNRIIIVEELKNEKLAKIPVLFDKKLKELTANFKAFPNRLLKAFPDLEKTYHTSFEKMKSYREQEKKRRKELRLNAKEHLKSLKNNSKNER